MVDGTLKWFTYEKTINQETHYKDEVGVYFHPLDEEEAKGLYQALREGKPSELLCITFYDCMTSNILYDNTVKCPEGAEGTLLAGKIILSL